MRLVDVRDVFLSILPEATFHYEAWAKPDKYIVWAEDGQGNTIFADDKLDERAIEGTADYYTKSEYDPVVRQIETAMDDSEMSWELSSVQHEEETGYIHYEWIWQVGDDLG
jgi:hypothetical protein